MVPPTSMAGWLVCAVLGLAGASPNAPAPPPLDLAFLLAASSTRARPDPEREPAALAVALGVFEIFDSDHHAVAGLEVRMPEVVHDLQPMLGLTFAEDESVYGYAGMRWNLELGARWRLSPGFAVGHFLEGDILDLGSSIEFRSSIELSRPIGARTRLGLELYHLSNSSITDVNPGTEGLVLNWSCTLD